jgi:cell wall-associated NlpC family hydrolase
MISPYNSLKHVTSCPALLLLTILSLSIFSCAKSVHVTQAPAPRHKGAMWEIMESYLGTPYQWGGTSRRGIDCSGLVMRVYEGVGIYLPRTTKEQRRIGKKAYPHRLRFGDILFFESRSDGRKGETLHSGLYLEEGRFIHASKSRGVVIESFQKPYWQDLFIEARRLE